MSMNEHTFQQTQHVFCNWLRDPNSVKDVPFALDRMQVYRELLFNNVCSFINLVYPVARSLLPEQQWQQLLADFFRESQNQSPLYNDISLQFREFLTEKQHPILFEYPWLAELLQYEWLELYLDTLEIEDVTLNAELNWQLTTQVWVLVYQYPVYQWSINQINIDPAPSAIMVWRNKHDRVCVEILTPLFAYLIEQLAQQPLPRIALAEFIQQIIPDLSFSEVNTQLDELAEDLIRLELLYKPD